MDSGNSGSLQSSSGAEEECDSRAVVDSIDSISPPAFITNNHHNPPPFNNHHHHLIFDQNQINNNHHSHHPLFFSSPQTPLLNLDNSVVWSKTLPPSSSSSSPDQINNTHHPFYNTSARPDHQFQNQFTPPVTTTNTTTTATAPATSTNPLPVRNPKKRSRASRRAPTTVLTTDTSNFRAMVQEFTGIPAPPFTSSSSSSPFPRLTRFDLFGTPSTIRSHPHNNFDNPPQLLPPYLLRPFPQKLQPPPPPPSSSSSSSSPSSISSLLNPSISNMQNSISIPSNFLNQSLSFLNNSKSVPTSNEFGLVHGLQPSMPELVSADRTAPAPPRNDSQAGNWGGSSGGGQGLNPTFTNGKGSAAAGDHHVPGLRSEGLMESWICSSSD